MENRNEVILFLANKVNELLKENEDLRAKSEQYSRWWQDDRNELNKLRCGMAPISSEAINADTI